MRAPLNLRRLPLLFTAALLALAASATAQIPPAWKPFSSAADGFSVLFPSRPVVSKSSVPAGLATYELHSWVAETGETALSVGVVDYGPSGASANPETLLTRAEKGAMEHANAHLLSEKRVLLDAGHGLDFEAESETLHFRGCLFLAGGVLYEILVASPPSRQFADAARFLDSFQLLKRSRR